MPIRAHRRRSVQYLPSGRLGNKPEIISNSAARAETLGASMRTKTGPCAPDSGGQIMTETQHRRKLSGTRMPRRLDWMHFLKRRNISEGCDGRTPGGRVRGGGMFHTRAATAEYSTADQQTSKLFAARGEKKVRFLSSSQHL